MFFIILIAIEVMIIVKITNSSLPRNYKALSVAASVLVFVLIALVLNRVFTSSE